MEIKLEVSNAFDNFIFDWDYERYLCIGGYGSGKSYAITTKIILKLLEEKRTCLVVREVYETITHSCYSLFCEILDKMNLLVEDPHTFKRKKNSVLASKSPMGFKFPNGSKIIFKGMDKPEKVKSLNGVSIVWLEECSEVKYTGYKELLGRIRTPDVSMHFILSCNPVSRENWVYRHFFVRLDDKGKETVLVNEDRFYENKVLVNKGTYLIHSTPDDNPWLPPAYIKRLDELKEYDYPLYMVARHGRFGATGLRVLPQLHLYTGKYQDFKRKISALGYENMYFGMDFGFETSYNAILCMSVDIEKGILYVWDEIYMNKITDDKFIQLPEVQNLRQRIKSLRNDGYMKQLIADNEDPKAIQYYRQNDFDIRPCRNKFAGSRLSNTRKMKRFKKIYISPRCKNTYRELKDLTYKVDSKGNVVYDQFNIDPHSFSAMWYALDMVTVADPKERIFNSYSGQ